MVRARDPPLGCVNKFEKKLAPVKPEVKTFRIVYEELAQELQEGFGVIQSEFRDYTNEFSDYRGGFREFRGEFHDYLEDFKDYRGGFRGFADMIDGNFKELGSRYDVISEKLSLTLETLREESSETRRMLKDAIEELRRGSAETRDELKRAVDNS